LSAICAAVAGRKRCWQLVARLAKHVCVRQRDRGEQEPTTAGQLPPPALPIPQQWARGPALCVAPCTAGICMGIIVCSPRNSVPKLFGNSADVDFKWPRCTKFMPAASTACHRRPASWLAASGAAQAPLLPAPHPVWRIVETSSRGIHTEPKLKSSLAGATPSCTRRGAASESTMGSCSLCNIVHHIASFCQVREVINQRGAAALAAVFCRCSAGCQALGRAYACRGVANAAHQAAAGGRRQWAAALHAARRCRLHLAT